MNSIDHVLLASLDLVFAQDPEGRFIYINEVTARAFGSDRHLLIGQHLIHTDLPPDIIQQLSADHHEIFTSSRPTRGELNLPMFYQDTVKDYEYTFSPVQGRQGTTEAAVFIAKDITERKRAEMALQASEAKYRSLFEAASDIILILDASDYQILNANWAAARKLGYSRQELLLLSIHGIEAQVDEARWVQIIERLEVSGEIIYEDSYRRKNGSTFPVEISAQLIEYEEQLCLQCFVRDITERKRAEEALNQQQKQIESVAANVPGVIYRGIFYRDGQFSLPYISEGEEWLSGYSVAEVMENPSLLLEVIHPEDRQFVMEQLELHRQSLQPWNLEYRILNRQEESIWIKNIARFSSHETGDVVIDGVTLDISDRKAAQLALERQLRQERLLRQVIEQIHQSLDLRTILQTAAEMTLTHLQVERVFISRFNPDWSTIIQVQAVSHTDLTIVNPNLISSPCVAGRYIEWYQQGQIMYAADIYHADYSPAFLEFLAQYQVRSHLAVPIIMPHMQTDDQTPWLWGLLIAHQCSQPREWQPDEIELMKQLATQTGIAIHQSELHHRLQVELQERTRAEAEVRTLNAELEQRVIERTFALQFANQDLEREIKNRIQYEETLRRYERIVSATQDAISLVDRNYIYQVVNRTYCNKYQREIEEIIGHSVVELLGNDTFEQVVRPYLDRCLAGEVVQYEAWFNYVTIEPCYMSVSYSPYLEQDGSISGVVASIRDITALKQTEEALAESERKLRKLMDAVPGVIYEYRKTVDGVEGFTAISQGIEALYEISSEEALSNVQLMEAIVVDADRPRLRAEIDRSAQELDRWTLEFQIQTPQGNLKWVLGRAVLHQANDGDIIWNGILLDVSDRKQAEEALCQSERRYATLTENAPVGIFRFDASGQCVYVNPSWCRMTGRSPEEGYGDAWVQILHPEDRDRLLSSWAQAFAQKSAFRNEGRHLLPDDTTNWFDCQMVPETDEQGDLTGYIGIVSDITIRKQAEIALQASEARYRQLVENIPNAAVQILDRELRVTFIGGQLLSILNLSPESVRGKHASEFIPPDDWGRVESLMQQAMKGDSTLGEIFYGDTALMLGVTPLYNTQGVIEGLLTVTVNITALKKAEQSLAISEARLRALIDALPLGIWVRDARDRLILQNPVNLSRYGYPIGSHLEEVHAPQEMIQRYKTIKQRCQVEGVVQFESTEWIQGEERTLLRINSTFPDLDGSMGMYGAAIDITERKQVESLLRKSEERFRLLFENAPIGIVVLEPPDFTLKYTNLFFQNLLGYTAEELKVISCEDFTHPDDIAIEAPLIQQCREGDRTYYQIEKRYIRKDQLEIWVNLVVVAVKSNIGEIQLCICIVEDITAQKRSETARQIAEDALLQAEARQRMILEAIPDLISLFSADGTLLDVVRNEPTLNLASKPKQFIGRNLMEILPQDLAIRQVQGIQKALATRELQIFEQQIRMNGYIRYEEVRIIPVDHNTTLRIVRDISDRKTLEESLRRSQITLKDILDNIDISIVRFCIFSRHQVEIEFVSAGCEAVFGYTADEMMNNPTLWLSRIVPEDLEMIVQPSWQRVCEVGTDMIIYRFRHKNNQICYIKSRVIAYRDDVQDCWFITALETVSLH